MRTPRTPRLAIVLLGTLAAAPATAVDITVLGGLTVDHVSGTTSMSLTEGDAWGFVLNIQDAGFVRGTETFCPIPPCRKFTKVYGDFDITFTGTKAAELNGQASNWTHGLIDGDALMWVKDAGGDSFETYIYLLPDDTEQHVYWNVRTTQPGGYVLDDFGFPVIDDTALGGASSIFYDFRGTNSGNVVSANGTLALTVVPEPGANALGVAVASALVADAWRRRNAHARSAGPIRSTKLSK
jgi:hypothetical protein